MVCRGLASITAAVRSMQAWRQPDGLRTSSVRLGCWIVCGSVVTTRSTDRSWFRGDGALDGSLGSVAKTRSTDRSLGEGR